MEDDEVKVIIINGQSYVQLPNVEGLYVQLRITPTPGGVAISFSDPLRLDELKAHSLEEWREQAGTDHLMQWEREQSKKG